MAWAVLVCDAGDDPGKVLRLLLERGHVRPVEGGYIVEAGGESDDPKTASTRRRQARYRARKRVARDAAPRDARDAAGPRNSEEFSGEIHSLSALIGPERVSETPENDARDARRDATRDARRDATRDATWADRLDLEVEYDADDLADDLDDDDGPVHGRIGPAAHPSAGNAAPVDNGPPLTAEQRAHAQAKVRELRAALRELRPER